MARPISVSKCYNENSFDAADKISARDARITYTHAEAKRRYAEARAEAATGLPRRYPAPLTPAERVAAALAR